MTLIHTDKQKSTQTLACIACARLTGSIAMVLRWSIENEDNTIQSNATGRTVVHMHY